MGEEGATKRGGNSDSQSLTVIISNKWVLCVKRKVCLRIWLQVCVARERVAGRNGW